MKSSRLLFAIVITFILLHAAAASAASVNMDDPRRALGREDDVRVDAQIFHDTVAAGTPISVTYQIHNLTPSTVAIASKVASASYDPETQTITLSIGSEVPDVDGLPNLVTIGPGEKRTMQVAATPQFATPRVRSPYVAVPRYVQVKVNILRDLEPFATLIEQKSRAPQQRVALSDELFERWMLSNDAIFLNTIPVRWSPRGSLAGNDIERSSAERRGSF